MHRTLLLCFIHGFKGGDDTFGGFPDHIRALVSHALPKVSVKAVTYPKFETRGDLKECVGRFREWLQNVVIDLEISALTPSPTIDPSVRTILIGHSMGGIVAAETLFAITSDAPVPAAKSRSTSAHSGPFCPSPELSPESSDSFMFPYIQGVLAFDTPYLGISPSVVAHGAETHYKTASSAYSALTEVASVFGYGAASNKSPPASPSPGKQPKALLPAPEPAKGAMAASNPDPAAAPTWQRWGKYAAFVGAAGAVAAGGAAAYFKRDTITEGWSWIGSHLEFVGCLMRAEELKTRLERMLHLQSDKGIGFKDLVTVLGNRAQGQTVAKGFLEINGPAVARERTFCTVPRSERNRKVFEKVLMEHAADEMEAHMSMFFPRENRGYYSMSERAKELVVGWVEREWYEGSEGVEGHSYSVGIPLQLHSTESLNYNIAECLELGGGNIKVDPSVACRTTERLSSDVYRRPWSQYLGASTGRIDVKLADGTLQSIFIEVISKDFGKNMVHRVLESMKTTYTPTIAQLSHRSR